MVTALPNLNSDLRCRLLMTCSQGVHDEARKLMRDLHLGAGNLVNPPFYKLLLDNWMAVHVRSSMQAPGRNA